MTLDALYKYPEFQRLRGVSAAAGTSEPAARLRQLAVTLRAAPLCTTWPMFLGQFWPMW